MAIYFNNTVLDICIYTEPNPYSLLHSLFQTYQIARFLPDKLAE